MAASTRSWLNDPDCLTLAEALAIHSDQIALPQHNPMSMQLGYALLRDRRVSIRAKLIALGIGAAAIGAIELLQLPVEGVVAALLPFIGVAGDLAMDGAEAVIGPVLIATLVLPHIASADIVQQIRAERARSS